MRLFPDICFITYTKTEDKVKPILLLLFHYRWSLTVTNEEQTPPQEMWRESPLMSQVYQFRTRMWRILHRYRKTSQNYSTCQTICSYNTQNIASPTKAFYLYLVDFSHSGWSHPTWKMALALLPQRYSSSLWRLFPWRVLAWVDSSIKWGATRSPPCRHCHERQAKRIRACSTTTSHWIWTTTLKSQTVQQSHWISTKSSRKGTARCCTEPSGTHCLCCPGISRSLWGWSQDRWLSFSLGISSSTRMAKRWFWRQLKWSGANADVFSTTNTSNNMYRPNDLCWRKWLITSFAGCWRLAPYKIRR